MIAIGLVVAAILGLIVSILIANYEHPILSFLLGSIIICAAILIYYFAFVMSFFFLAL